MGREETLRSLDNQTLDRASRPFGICPNDLKMVPDYEGCANLVFEYERDGQSRILRISVDSRRTAEWIQAELHFVTYLSEHGVRVSTPVMSEMGRLIESLRVGGQLLHVVSFVKGKGVRVPDNDYRYREDAPIEEYFQNWGRMLGRMHAVVRDYRPISKQLKRPEWFELHRERLAIVPRLSGESSALRRRVHALLDEIRSLPRSVESHGLIHGDFNDGNFTVDYANGDITVFDFDDCCYFWFMHELAAAWEGGIGRVMFRGLKERTAFMKNYMDQVMEGYTREHTLSDESLALLPLFVKLIHVEEFLHYAQYGSELDATMRRQQDYRIRCIEDDIPYMGFFDDIYCPDRPFSL